MIDTLFPYCTDSVKDRLVTSPKLKAKVGPSGELLPFPGNTVVFLLEEEEKRRLAEIQSGLYRALNESGRPMLAEKLQPSTFHLTLHDLANPELGENWESRKAAMAERSAAFLREIWADTLPLIHMRATYTFQMVNTSIVLGLEPAEDGSSWRLLDDLYNCFQSVRPLNYALTPHITLAYFIPGEYAGQDLVPLKAALGPVKDFPVQLDTNKLVLQDFENMNCYRTVYGKMR